MDGARWVVSYQQFTGFADPKGMKRIGKVRGSWFPTHSAKRRGMDGARWIVSYQFPYRIGPLMCAQTGAKGN
jgi:hypothetical protein